MGPRIGVDDRAAEHAGDRDVATGRGCRVRSSTVPFHTPLTDMIETSFSTANGSVLVDQSTVEPDAHPAAPVARCGVDHQTSCGTEHERAAHAGAVGSRRALIASATATASLSTQPGADPGADHDVGIARDADRLLEVVDARHEVHRRRAGDDDVVGVTGRGRTPCTDPRRQASSRSQRRTATCSRTAAATGAKILPPVLVVDASACQARVSAAPLSAVGLAAGNLGVDVRRRHAGAPRRRHGAGRARAWMARRGTAAGCSRPSRPASWPARIVGHSARPAGHPVSSRNTTRMSSPGGTANSTDVVRPEFTHAWYSATGRTWRPAGRP